jgi:type II secretory pathway component GspD/PulD (secretin)
MRITWTKGLVLAVPVILVVLLANAQARQDNPGKAGARAPAAESAKPQAARPAAGAQAERPIAPSTDTLAGNRILMLPLEHQPAASVAAVMLQMRPAFEGDLLVVAFPEANSLLVAAPEKVHAQVKELVRALDQPSATKHADSSTYRSFQLKHGDAREAEGVLQRLFAQKRLLTAVDTRTNIIWFAANEGLAPEVERVLQSMDQPSKAEDSARASGPQLKIVIVKNAPAGNMARVLAQVIKLARLSANVTADERSNRLIMQAGPVEAAALEGLVAQLDVTPTSPQDEPAPKAGDDRSEATPPTGEQRPKR